MTIITRHNITDPVFYLANNGVIKNSEVMQIVTSSVVNARKPGEMYTEVNYRLKDAVGVLRTEGSLFTSVSELTKSLEKQAESQAEIKQTDSKSAEQTDFKKTDQVSPGSETKIK